MDCVRERWRHRERSAGLLMALVCAGLAACSGTGTAYNLGDAAAGADAGDPVDGGNTNATDAVVVDDGEVSPDATPGDCGNGSCDPGEDCASCAADCGACPGVCGNAACDATESCWSCAADCGQCNCPTPVEVVIYNESAWNIIADAFVAEPCFCADYYLSLPALTADKTLPRAAGEPAGIRARGPRFHALAEFHWGAWSTVAGPWYDKGVEFRIRMGQAGYDVSAGDTWAVNELPSSARSDPAVRQNVLDALHGLHDGPAGSLPAEGAVFIIGMGQGTVNFSVYKPNLKTWIEEASFWSTANLYARWWAQEVYTDPDYVCVSGTTVAVRSAHINEYVEHVARLAEVGPSAANTAQSYFSWAYLPLMNAAWQAPSGYGNTLITLDQMKHHVSTQAYAARAWSNNHAYPDGRIGFAWARKGTATNAELAELAERLARAIRYAYDEGGGAAAGACSPSQAYTWCACDVAGAAFNTGWSTFSTW
ncbi:MAG: hypothetical protein ABI333_00255 [bacterium]